MSESIESYIDDSPILKWLRDNGKPLTRQSYIAMATLGQDEDYEWSDEDEAGMPPPLRLTQA